MAPACRTAAYRKWWPTVAVAAAAAAAVGAPAGAPRELGWSRHTAAPTESPADVAAAVAAAIRPVLANKSQVWNGSAISVAFHRDGATAAVAAGNRSFRPAAPASPRDLFLFGTTTQMYTSAAVLARCETGDLALGDLVAPIVDPLLYSANGTTLGALWGGYMSTVTIGHLLGMRSGIADYHTYDLRVWQTQNPGVDLTPVDVLHLAPKGFACAPGACGVYSSTGYVLLGWVLAAKAGARGWDAYDQLAWLRGISPGLNTSATFFAGRGAASQFDRPEHPMAHGYQPYGNDVYGTSALGGWTSGNLVAAPRDVAQFAYELYRPGSSLLSAYSQSLQRNFTQLSDGYTFYGLGTEFLPGSDSRGQGTTGAYVGHYGATWGFYSIAGYNYKHDFALTIATNEEQPTWPGKGWVGQNMLDIHKAVYDAVVGVMSALPKAEAGSKHNWDGTCFACARFPEMANFTGRDLDWVAKGAVTPVKAMNLPCDIWPVPCNDNPPCWNCGVYAAVQDVESAWFLAGHDLVNLSVRHVTDCAPSMAKAPLKHPDNCGGGSRYHFWDWMIDNGGVASEQSYPLGSEPQPTLDHPVPCRVDLADPLEAGVTAWFRLAMAEDAPADAEALLLEAVRRVGPVSACITSSHLHHYYGGVDNPGQNGSSTGTEPCVPAWEHTCDHAVNVVGYGYDPVSKLDYWKIRNEWGTDWGEGGYYRLARGQNHCGIASYAYHATVVPKDRFHCHATSQKCVAAFSGHSTLENCNAACLPQDRWHCDAESQTCVAAVSGHSTLEKCNAACLPQDRWHCDAESQTCIAAVSGHSTLAKCDAACNQTAPLRFHCDADSQTCVVAFEGHSTLEKCEAACAPGGGGAPPPGPDTAAAPPGGAGRVRTLLAIAGAAAACACATSALAWRQWRQARGGRRPEEAAALLPSNTAPLPAAAPQPADPADPPSATQPPKGILKDKGSGAAASGHA